MEQRSEEWFKARIGVITGSRVGSILGVNPYQSADDVMRDMVREYFGLEKEFKGNAATAHGERMEPVALEFYQRKTGNNVELTGMVKHDEYDFLGASPDGLIGLDGGLEIKCPYWAKRPYSIHEKPSYYAQVQLVMAVCDLQWMDFLCYISDEEYLLERVKRDEGWLDTHLGTLRDFHSRFTEIINDEKSANRYDAPPQSEPTLEGGEAKRLSELWLQIADAERAIAPLKDEFDTLKRKLGEAHGSFRTELVKVIRVEKKGSVDNKALYKDLNVEGLLSNHGKTLDDYRRESVVSYSVTKVEGES